MSKLIYRITLLGEGTVGKTSLRQRFMGKGFTSSHLMTVGADFAAKDMIIELNGKKHNVVFQIWDVAGQKRFAEIRSRFFIGSNAGICVFDITRPDSFKIIPQWIEELWKHNGQRPPVIPIIIVGNKSDLRDRKSVPTKSAIDYCTALTKKTKAYGFEVTYIETSALNGENIELAFDTIGKSILKKQFGNK